MEPLEIASQIQAAFPEEVKGINEFRGQVSVTVKKERIKDLMSRLWAAPEYYFDFLEDLCGADYLGKKEPRFEVVYNLHSMRHRHKIRIKAEVPESDCFIDSVTTIWAGANWHERECYDLFGIRFIGHPDHRRILMPEDWEGHPLRKDYPLQGNLGEWEWPEFKAVIETSKRNKRYEVR
jgi:NADH-quinone oxidoreductase subunit C